MRHVPGAAVVVLSPHLDDAVLSAWAVLRGRDGAMVVNVCDGVPPPGPPPRWDRFTGATDAAERMRERLAEDRAALARAGRPAVGLGFLDAQYREKPLDSASLVRAIAAAAPEATELWAPAGVGAHPDHLQVREAALTLAAGSGPPLRLYADLPYAARTGWPDWVGDRRGAVDRDGWHAELPGGRSLPIAVHRLSPSEVARKLRALREYRTQWTALDAVTAGALGRRRTLRYEVSFDATPALAGGGD